MQLNMTLTIERIEKPKNLQKHVYHILKNYITHPDVPPGTHLYEEKLAKEIGVSRTPVKIALNLLEKEGFVVIQPNKGAFKVHFHFQEIKEIIKIRMTLECLSLEIGEFLGNQEMVTALECSIPDIDSFITEENLRNYVELDRQFHEDLIKIGNSQWLNRMIKDQDPIFHMIRQLSLRDINRINLSIKAHKRIVEPLKKGRISLTQTRIREHWKSVIKYLEQNHKNTPGLFL
ncbi:MAG: GntR family transcriptional regulator [Pseudomonadota bacterium]